MITIRPATLDEADWLQSSFDSVMGWTKPSGYFETICDLQAQGELALLIATTNTDYLGHCTVVWQLYYSHFREHHIPEIQDLNVSPDYRRQGIGTKLLDEAERRIQERSTQAGIGFGLYADYGSAQRLYIKRGYVPDGHGVFYKNRPVTPGASHPVDDALVLYLVKQF